MEFIYIELDNKGIERIAHNGASLNEIEDNISIRPELEISDSRDVYALIGGLFVPHRTLWIPAYQNVKYENDFIFPFAVTRRQNNSEAKTNQVNLKERATIVNSIILAYCGVQSAFPTSLIYFDNSTLIGTGFRFNAGATYSTETFLNMTL